MVLVTLGVVYGDIGTSPMYTMRAIVEGNGGLSTVSDDLILGALSLLIWTITLITTVKYVLIAMKADNHNEGGIFALYGLVRKCGKWLILPAMIGGAALLADGILTPAVTVTTAVEGLRTTDFGYALLGEGQTRVVVITIVILAVLFMVQRSGTSNIGRAFGPVMTVWFLFLAFGGLLNIGSDLNVLRAFNPLRGITFLFSSENRAGMMILGNVFLCTTGAEALYSDMGHVGKSNIYASWPMVKACLIINYLGQGAWCLANCNDPALVAMGTPNPFYEMLPEGLRPFAVVLSALAAIIASQALITGSYTLISEATRLDLMPHMRVSYPSETKGQLYIPLVNNIMWIGCTIVVLFFQSSSRMEAAYGLAITLTMLMTTLLLYIYISKIMRRHVMAVPFVIFFGLLESTFFFSSLTKFMHGGYFTIIMATLLFIVMYVWRRGTAIERSQTVFLPVSKYVDQLARLRDDESQEMCASNLVFLTNDGSLEHLDRDILYSILDKRPKRARAYWFLNVQVTDEPYTCSYVVNSFGTDFVFKVQLQLGFRVNQRMNTFLRQIVGDLIASGELAPQERSYSIYKDPGSVGDFRFCMLRKQLTADTSLSAGDQRVLMIKYFIRRICGSPVRWYGLENSTVLIEYVPLFASIRPADHLKRIPLDRVSSQIRQHEVRAQKNADDSDIFSLDVMRSRAKAEEETETTLIGGDTAVFDALRMDEEGSDDDDAEGTPSSES
ncbi:MAG: KUP/HAK/KT family potassium transporter [Atopobiaceae bacterium]|jgi:KUP system potassium uptake protein|nr:KUP/HAK/KT family potassium transporter [Atopobiaceae bacterium]MCH4120309.1 KUP/HAK/KT family potassium transporter [Atopobiaceae bacterium]MCI1318373.1 KUP/HAK/KT family potassium transporter [Atopobiaceae bacterium]MCI1389272.1 KUP/HAK/KT family potassium transporter [Atopobiaceae bacterium]MCI1432335.1 KUP/HAK/KT family potassium transporter [Atopobiaceae bacterium]